MLLKNTPHITNFQEILNFSVGEKKKNSPSNFTPNCLFLYFCLLVTIFGGSFY